MSKTVKFRGGSPSGQSYLGHQPSDSGVGSFSDSESRAAYPDHAYAGSDYDSPTLYALEESLANEVAAKEGWMKKATELDSLLLRAHKELKETEARLRALEDHAEELEDDNAKLTKANKDLTEENARLKDDLKDAKKSSSSSSSSSTSSRRKSSSPPVMSGAIAADEEKKEKPRRSASKKHGGVKESERAEREKERERIHREIEREMERERAREKTREMDRLRRRFNKDGGEESDTKSSNTSSKERDRRNRRDSYVEPLGQPAPRPQVVPPSPSRHYSYSNNPYPQQTYQSGNVPRAAHPSVVVSYGDSFHDDREEDGMYHPHPLPKQQRAPERRDRERR
ncbi:hypothetical protein OQA88_6283 [Cercophora sp. LCS_1]